MQTRKPNSYLAARVISTLFVPPSLTILLFTFFALHFEQSLSGMLTVLFVAYLCGFIFPIIMFFYLRKKGKIVDQDASIKEERTLPFIIAVLIYTGGLIVLVKSNVNIISSSMWFCYISNTLIVVLINKFWKISAHALGVAGPLGAMTFVLGLKGFIFVFLLLAVGWARIKLKRHTPMQVVAGSLLGFALTYFQMSFFISNFK